MVKRPFWIKRIEKAWKSTPIAWLSGVRRVGKTTLAKAIPNAAYLNCDLPSARERLFDPETFFRTVTQPVVVFDEIHQLSNPSQILKIGADEFRHLKILATGSSTLAATAKFRDSLTGRKRQVHLTPVLFQECSDFGSKDIEQRLLLGGLPDPLLRAEVDSEFFSEWIDSFYARDVQELFRVDKRHSFLFLLELVLRQSAGPMEITGLSKKAGISRPTVMNYLSVLETTHAIRLIRPFHGGGGQELLRQPKAYGFDTGFICALNGWNELHEAEKGRLWEHLVLDELLSGFPANQISFWRDKSGNEIDFVVTSDPKRPLAIECKWSPRHFNAKALTVFRKTYPLGRNQVICPNIKEPYSKEINGLNVSFSNPTDFHKPDFV